MTDRIAKLISFIPSCEVFADIGCDHGYVAKGVLDGGKVKKAIISDISEKCLQKAVLLLNDYIEKGRVNAVVSDGFKNLPCCDVALIAGMGGEEIIKIISDCESLPNRIVLQPMKNCDKVRKFVVDNGYFIEFDGVFFLDGKYYDILSLVKGDDFLTEDEILFGRSNLKSLSLDFINRLKEQKKLLKSLLKKDLSDDDKIKKQYILEKIEKYV